MSRRIHLALAVMAFAAAATAHAESASDRSCTRDGVTRLVPARAELAALFARREPELIPTATGRVSTMGPSEVMMARVGADGKIVIVCVDTEAAARHFLDAPVESLARVKEK
jgi:NAD(P)H-dependent flavin oxidoreductase YrpB (nitropropane dioxygenase family)